jgi:hypothetical protein
MGVTISPETTFPDKLPGGFPGVRMLKWAILCSIPDRNARENFSRWWKILAVNEASLDCGGKTGVIMKQGRKSWAPEELVAFP